MSIVKNRWQANMDFPTLFSELHLAGAERFGADWLKAQDRTVSQLRRDGFDSELTDSSKLFAYCVSVAVFEALNVAHGWDTAEHVAKKLSADAEPGFVPGQIKVVKI